MEKRKFSWFWVLIGLLIFMIVGSFLGWVIYDKLDWLTMIILFGFVILAGKLNKILELLEKKKK